MPDTLKYTVRNGAIKILLSIQFRLYFLQYVAPVFKTESFLLNIYLFSNQII